MFGSDDAPLTESLSNMYFVRGAIDGKADDRFVRERIAMLIWLPALIVLTMLAIWLQAAIILAIGIPALLIGLWLYAERRRRPSSDKGEETNA